MLMIQKSEVSKKTYVVLGSKKGENKYKRYKDKLVCKTAGTKKCGCIFKLKGRFVRTIGWRFIVVCGFHNHKVMTTLFGHSYASHLSSEEKTLVNQLTKNMVKPGQILLAIKDQDQTNVNTIKIIYNECHKYCHEQRGPRSKYNI